MPDLTSPRRETVRPPRDPRVLAATLAPPSLREEAAALGRRLVARAAASVARRPVTTLAALAMVGAAGVITLNAAAYQVRRHPSPLFGKPSVEAARPPAPREAARPDPRRAEGRLEPRQDARQETRPDPRPAAPAARPAAAERPSEQAQGQAQGQAQAHAHLPAHAQAAAPLPPSRPASGPSADVATGSVSPAAPPRKPDVAVAAAQRALAKLGHPTLKDDGLLGPQTRTAIERFERERKLKVTGEANPRTLRELQERARLAAP